MSTSFDNESFSSYDDESSVYTSYSSHSTDFFVNANANENANHAAYKTDQGLGVYSNPTGIPGRVGFWTAVMKFSLRSQFRHDRICGVYLLVFAALSFFFACALLSWNETAYHHAEQVLIDIKQQIVSAPVYPTPDFDGKLVHITAEIQTKHAITDPITKLTVSSPLVTRSVLQYQNRTNKWHTVYDPLTDLDTSNDDAHLLAVSIFPFHWEAALYVGQYQLSPYLQQQVLYNEFFTSTKDQLITTHEAFDNDDVQTVPVSLEDSDVTNFKQGLDKVQKLYDEQTIRVDTTYNGNVYNDMVKNVETKTIGLGSEIKVKWQDAAASIQRYSVFGFSKTDCKNNADTILFPLKSVSTAIAMEYIPAGTYKSVCFGRLEVTKSTNKKTSRCDSQEINVVIEAPLNAVKWMYVIEKEQRIYFELNAFPVADGRVLSKEIISKYRIGFSKASDCIWPDEQSAITKFRDMLFYASFTGTVSMYQSLCFSTNEGTEWKRQIQSPHVFGTIRNEPLSSDVEIYTNDAPKTNSDMSIELLLEPKPVENAFMLRNLAGNAVEDGKVKINYTMAKITKHLEVTVLARLQLGTDNVARLDRWISEHELSRGTSIEMMMKGRHKIDDFFWLQGMEIRAVLWLLRVITFFMIAGAGSVYSWYFHEVLIELPAIRLMENRSVVKIGALFGTFVYFVIFITCWTVHHQFEGSIVIVVAVCLLLAVKIGDSIHTSSEKGGHK